MSSKAGILPTYKQLIPEVLEALAKLGGSASGSEIIDQVLDQASFSPEMVEVAYPNRNKSVLVDRIEWARSYATLMGLAERPSRGTYLLTREGKELLSLTRSEAESLIKTLDSQVRKQRRGLGRGDSTKDGDEIEQEIADELSTERSWKDALIDCLHRLSPGGFEQFVVFLLREYGLELDLVSGSGDNGVDAIGLAPISEVLSSRVAVQVKRYQTASPVSREEVALFQRDAAARGAERAIFVTLSRFTKPAQNAAIESTPTVNLIDGDRLCKLSLQKGLGIEMFPRIKESWFEKFQ